MATLMIEAEPLAGSTVERAVKDAIRVAAALDVGIRFDRNGVKLFVFGHSDAGEKLARYNAELSVQGTFPGPAEEVGDDDE